MISRDKTEYITVDEFKALQRRPAAGNKSKVTEKDIMNQIRDFLRLHGWMVIRNHQTLGSYPGVTDLTAIRGGKVVWIEVKTPRGRLGPDQEKFLQDLEDHGGWWIVARSVEDVEHLVRDVV